MTGPTDSTGFAQVDALLAAGRVAEAAEAAEVVILDGALSGESAARLRLKLSSALLMNGYAAEATSQVEAVLAEQGLDDDLYGAGRLTRLIALMAQDEFTLSLIHI